MRTTWQMDEEVAARCETVLNTTMAEFDTYHTQKKEDFERLMKDHLDGEIELYQKVSLESNCPSLNSSMTISFADFFIAPRTLTFTSSQILTRLYSARQAFDIRDDQAAPNSPRAPSIYERSLSEARIPAPPLSQPFPHVLD